MKLDWHALLRVGLGPLRLRPDDFWALTPVELLLIAGVTDAFQPLEREALERLSAAFPDRRSTR